MAEMIKKTADLVNEKKRITVGDYFHYRLFIHKYIGHFLSPFSYIVLFQFIIIGMFSSCLIAYAVKCKLLNNIAVTVGCRYNQP